MTKYYKTGGFLLACMLCLNAIAQSNGTSSSYSRFGLGILENQAQGFNKGMGGVGLGYRAGNRINTLNPASYSAIDSVTILVDAGMSVALGNMKQNGTSLNIYQCKLDYVTIGLRLYRNLGLSAGFMPFTSVGYNFTTTERVSTDPYSDNINTSTVNYAGEGGLHQAYLGLGYKLYKELSVGANASFIWGSYAHTLLQTYSTGTSSGLNSLEGAEIRTWKLDMGVQYPVRLTKTDLLTLGATASIGHKIKNEAQLSRFTDTEEGTPIDTVKNAFDLPYTYGIGATWKRKENLTVGLDFKQEFWGSCRMPAATATGASSKFVSKTGLFKNRTKIAAGAQFIPNPYDRHYWKRIQYRIGASYSTPYLVVNGQDGPREISLTAGFGLPITNAINNRSIINFGVEWLRRAPSSSNMITENYVMLNLGITFNEAWFMKYKIQ